MIPRIRATGLLMGYYVDLVFDEKEKYHYKTLVKRFCKAGAHKNIYPREEDLHLPELSYGEMLISLCDEEILIEKGVWAEIRLSWGTDPYHMHDILKTILELAEKVGCRVYDGQLGDYVTVDNLDQVLGFFEGERNSFENAIGFVDTGKKGQKSKKKFGVD